MIDTFTGLAMWLVARAAGAKLMVFDWDKAATLIVERGAKYAAAGLEGDWDWTGGSILVDARPTERGCHFLSSLWAIPQLQIDNDDVIDCWRYKEDTPGWDAETFWPDSARAILMKGR